MIHGDFWFSNIILTYDDNYKFIDMKGHVDNILTINGDVYYDYGKLFQSIIGYDLVLNGINIKEDNIYNMIMIMAKYFLEKCKNKGLNLNYLRAVTKGLIFGTFHSLKENNTIKKNIWDILNCNLLNN